MAVVGKTSAKPSRRPARRFSGIEARWSPGDRSWRWRARLVAGGRVNVGPLRDSQEHAAADRAELESRVGAFRRAEGITLGAALDQVVLAAERRGVLERTVRDDYQVRQRFLERMLPRETPLLELATVDRLLEFVQRARKLGRSAATIRRDLWMLGCAFRDQRLPDVVQEVRRAVRDTLKAAPARTEYLSTQAVREILRRIRAGDTVDGQLPPSSEQCQADADVIELLAVTGIRAGELGRVRVRDVEFDPPRLHVREPKDRGNPRVCDLPTASLAMLRRVVDRARERPGDTRRAIDRLLFPGSERLVGETCSRWRRLLGLDLLHGRALRHSFSTAAALDGGAALNELMELAGHRRAATTSRYTHAVGARRREIVERVGSALLGDQPEGDR